MSISLKNIAKGDDLVLAIAPTDLDTGLALALSEIDAVWFELAPTDTGEAAWEGTLTGTEVSKDASSGSLLVTIPASATADFPAQLYAYCKVELSDGYLSHLIRATELTFADTPLAQTGLPA